MDQRTAPRPTQLRPAATARRPLPASTPAALYKQLEHTAAALQALNRQGVPTRQLTRSELLSHSQSTDPALRDINERLQALTQKISPPKKAQDGRRKKAQDSRKGRHKKQATVAKTGTGRQAGNQRGAKGGNKKAAAGTAKTTGAAKTATQRGTQRGNKGSNKKPPAGSAQSKGAAKQAVSSSSDSDSSDDSDSDSDSDSGSGSDSASSAAPTAATKLATISLHIMLRDFSGEINRHRPAIEPKCLFAVAIVKPFGQPCGCVGQAASSGGRICHRCAAEQTRRAKPKAASEAAAAASVAKAFFKLKSGRYVTALPGQPRRAGAKALPGLSQVPTRPKPIFGPLICFT